MSAWPSPFIVISQQASHTTGTKLYENGIIKTTSAANSNGGPAGITLGGRRFDDLFAHCDIAEFICYGDALSDTDHASVVTYLKSKYGIL